MTFSDLKFKPMEEIPGGVQARAVFANGYEASVVRHQHSYGGPSGFYELAVLHNGRIVYDTPVTSDVLGWLEEDAVTAALQQIEQLPMRGAA